MFQPEVERQIEQACEQHLRRHVAAIRASDQREGSDQHIPDQPIAKLADDDQRLYRRLVARNAVQPLGPDEVTLDPYVAPCVTQGTIQQ